MSFVSPIRLGAVMLTALIFFLSGPAVAQTEPATATPDTTVELAHFIILKGARPLSR